MLFLLSLLLSSHLRGCLLEERQSLTHCCIVPMCGVLLTLLFLLSLLLSSHLRGCLLEGRQSLTNCCIVPMCGVLLTLLFLLTLQLTASQFQFVKRLDIRHALDASVMRVDKILYQCCHWLLNTTDTLTVRSQFSMENMNSSWRFVEFHHKSLLIPQ